MNNKIKKNLFILSITSIKQLEENDLDYWHQKKFIEINTRVIVPSKQEININSRARSAKLRIAEKK